MAETKTPVEELEGREMDRAIAEEAMGWDTNAPDSIRGVGAITTTVDPDGSLHREIPHYSTDIAAAWEVMEEMDVDDGRGFVFRGLVSAHRPKWFHLDASEAAEMICRAALKAVRSKDD